MQSIFPKIPANRIIDVTITDNSSIVKGTGEIQQKNEFILRKLCRDLIIYCSLQ